MQSTDNLSKSLQQTHQKSIYFCRFQTQEKYTPLPLPKETVTSPG